MFRTLHNKLNVFFLFNSQVDIFALGLTLLEAATGRPLPLNGQEWQDIRNGVLPDIPGFSTGFQELLKLMVHQDPNMRPTATQLIDHELLLDEGSSSTAGASRGQLKRELELARLRNEVLEKELQQAKYYLAHLSPCTPINVAQKCSGGDDNGGIGAIGTSIGSTNNNSYDSLASAIRALPNHGPHPLEEFDSGRGTCTPPCSAGGFRVDFDSPFIDEIGCEAPHFGGSANNGLQNFSNDSPNNFSGFQWNGANGFHPRNGANCSLVNGVDGFHPETGANGSLVDGVDGFHQGNGASFIFSSGCNGVDGAAPPPSAAAASLFTGNLFNRASANSSNVSPNPFSVGDNNNCSKVFDMNAGQEPGINSSHHTKSTTRQYYYNTRSSQHHRINTKDGMRQKYTPNNRIIGRKTARSQSIL